MHLDREQELLKLALRKAGAEGERLAHRLANEYGERREPLKDLAARLQQHPAATLRPRAHAFPAVPICLGSTRGMRHEAPLRDRPACPWASWAFDPCAPRRPENCSFASCDTQGHSRGQHHKSLRTYESN